MIVIHVIYDDFFMKSTIYKIYLSSKSIFTLYGIYFLSNSQYKIRMELSPGILLDITIPLFSIDGPIIYSVFVSYFWNSFNF